MEIDKTERFRLITKNMADTYERKNADYGDSFSQSVRRYGPIAGVVRISDKFHRLENLALGHTRKVADESVIDTLTDMACYCIMLRMELEQH